MSLIAELITETDMLERAIAGVRKADFVAIDTEFMREHTYYPELCLIQISDGQNAFCIDPLSSEIDLTALFELLQDEKIIKVFHAGRQDLEIFVHLTDKVPTPLYDTQIAAMVCGFGDQIGYDKLVQHYKGIQLDKSSRFTDWSKRPLSSRQISYALDDVIHLADIYPKMMKELKENGREKWVQDELANLAAKDLYQAQPAEMWKRIKSRNNKADYLNRLSCLAKWREIEAQKRNVPRGRILRDDTLLDLAGSNPVHIDELRNIRGFPGGEKGKFGPSVIKTLQQAALLPKQEWPFVPAKKSSEKAPAALVDLLRVLLKHITEKHKVAPRLIASADELEQLALSDNADIPALNGWRFEIFGRVALDLKAGKLALCVQNGNIKLVATDGATSSVK